MMRRISRLGATKNVMLEYTPENSTNLTSNRFSQWESVVPLFAMEAASLSVVFS